MKKTPVRNAIIDKLHKGFVLTCVAVTVYGIGHLGLRWYRYFTVLRPEAKKRELLENKNLLAEGSSDLLQDSAQTLKS